MVQKKSKNPSPHTLFYFFALRVRGFLPWYVYLFLQLQTSNFTDCSFLISSLRIWYLLIILCCLNFTITSLQWIELYREEADFPRPHKRRMPIQVGKEHKPWTRNWYFREKPSPLYEGIWYFLVLSTM